MPASHSPSTVVRAPRRQGQDDGRRRSLQVRRLMPQKLGLQCRGGGGDDRKEVAGEPVRRAASLKRRQLVLLKSLNLVPKSEQTNGARRLHARANRQAA